MSHTQTEPKSHRPPFPVEDTSGGRPFLNDTETYLASIAISLKRIADVLTPRVTGPENGSVLIGELSDALSDRFLELAQNLGNR